VVRESGFIGDMAVDSNGAAAQALRGTFSTAAKAIAVLDAEDVHQYGFGDLLDHTELQLVLILRSAFPRGLEIALTLGEGLQESDRTGVRVLAATWGDSRFPSAAMVDSGSSDGFYRFVIGRPGQADSTLGFAALLDVDRDVAAAFEAWFVQIWDLATELDRVCELEQPSFGRPDREVVAGLVARWNRFAEGVGGEREPAPTPPRGPGNNGAADGEDRDLDLDVDASAPWALFALNQPVSSAKENGAEAAVAVPEGTSARTSILAVIPSSPIERDLREIYARGALVSVHTSKKVPTFRFDVNAALGIAEGARWGPASVRSPIRLALLPDEVSREVEQARGRASRLLGSYSFLLAMNQHWMPQAAIAHFAETMKAMSGKQELTDLLGGDLGAFVESRMEEYSYSLEQSFREQKMNISMTDDRCNQLREAITDYLEKQGSITVEATFTAENLGYMGDKEADYTRPFALLLAVSKKTRRRVAAGESRDRKIPVPPLKTWDVVGGDILLSACGPLSAPNARTQLKEIEQIEKAGPSEQSCGALIALMRSAL